MNKIIIDLNSSETNYETILLGVKEFLSKTSKYVAVLIGNELNAKHILHNIECSTENIIFIDNKDALLDSDNPTLVLKEKKSCSLVKSIEMLKKDSDTIGLISCGPTGGLLISSIFHLGLERGLRTPSLSCVLKSFRGKDFILTDCGANLDVDPQTFVKFAEINAKYANAFVAKYPRVALLNVGVEKKKGNNNLKNAFELLSNNKNINFIGNIEGFDVFNEKADVILTDGVNGNIFLKVAESLARGFEQIYSPYLKEDKKEEVNKFIENNFYYSSKGGAILIGARKPIIKLHGKSETGAVSISLLRLVEIFEGLSNNAN